MSHSRLLSSLLLGLLLGRGAVAAGQPLPEPEPPRLSGTIIISDTVRRAIVCDAEGNSTVLGIGDEVKGWGVITTIEPDRVMIRTRQGEEAFMLSDGGFTFLASHSTRETLQQPAKADVSMQPYFKRSVGVTPALSSAVERLINNNGTDRDLAEFLEKYLDLPPTLRITAVDHQPITDDGKLLQRVRRSLSNSSTIQLSVAGEGAEADDGIYLLPRREELQR